MIHLDLRCLNRSISLGATNSVLILMQRRTGPRTQPSHGTMGHFLKCSFPSLSLWFWGMFSLHIPDETYVIQYKMLRKLSAFTLGLCDALWITLPPLSSDLGASLGHGRAGGWMCSLTALMDGENEVSLLAPSSNFTSFIRFHLVFCLFILALTDFLHFFKILITL